MLIEDIRTVATLGFQRRRLRSQHAQEGGRDRLHNRAPVDGLGMTVRSQIAAIQNYRGAVVCMCIEQPAIWSVRLPRLADEVLKSAGEHLLSSPVLADYIEVAPQGS